MEAIKRVIKDIIQEETVVITFKYEILYNHYIKHGKNTVATTSFAGKIIEFLYGDDGIGVIENGKWAFMPVEDCIKFLESEGYFQIPEGVIEQPYLILLKASKCQITRKQFDALETIFWRFLDITNDWIKTYNEREDWISFITDDDVFDNLVILSFTPEQFEDLLRRFEENGRYDLILKFQI